jgi:hypothetical protein
LGKLTIYQNRKAEEARRAAIEQERIAREAAERMAREAATVEQLDAAIAVEAEAEKAAAVVAAKPAELSRSRGDYGAVASLREHWTFEVTDFTQVPREYLCVDQPTVRDAIKRKVREVPGLRIYCETRTVVS